MKLKLTIYPEFKSYEEMALFLEAIIPEIKKGYNFDTAWRIDKVIK